MDNNELTKIYVCSPYRATTQADIEINVCAAQQYCRFIIGSTPGALPIAPHIYFTQFMDDDKTDERTAALEFGKRLLAECKEIWVFGSLVSDGMAAEISEAGRLQIPIRWFTEGYKERAVSKPQEVNDDGRQ